MSVSIIDDITEEEEEQSPKINKKSLYRSHSSSSESSTDEDSLDDKNDNDKGRFNTGTIAGLSKLDFPVTMNNNNNNISIQSTTQSDKKNGGNNIQSTEDVSINIIPATQNSTCVICHTIDLPTSKDLPFKYCDCYMHQSCASSLVMSGIKICEYCNKNIDLAKNAGIIETISIGVEENYSKYCSYSLCPFIVFICFAIIIITIIAWLLGWMARFIYLVIINQESINITIGSQIQSVNRFDIYWGDLLVGLLLCIIIYIIFYILISFIKKSGINCCCKKVTFRQFFGAASYHDRKKEFREIISPVISLNNMSNKDNNITHVHPNDIDTPDMDDTPAILLTKVYRTTEKAVKKYKMKRNKNKN